LIGCGYAGKDTRVPTKHVIRLVHFPYEEMT